MLSIKKVRGYFCLLYFFCASQLFAQNTQPIPLPTYLTSLETQYDITFSVDAELIQGMTLTAKDTVHASLEEALQKLNANTVFDFQSIDENNFIVVPKNIDGGNKSICVIFKDNETDFPLRDVTAKTKNKFFTSGSDENGELRLSDNFKLSDSITFSTFGFESKTFRIIDLVNQPCRTIPMKIQTTYMSEIVIEGYMAPGINSMVNDHSLQIKQDELAIIPGETSGDVLQSISILPGISSPNTKAGNLFVRGSTTDQTMVYFDDIPLYNKGHYFGAISPFNQLVVDEVRVYRSGSHPSIGGRVGGTIQIKTEAHVPDSIRNAVGMSMTSFMGYTHIPIVKKKLSLLVSGRYALPSSWNTPRQKTILDFLNQDDGASQRATRADFNGTYDFKYHFNDFNSKLIFEPDSNNKLMASFIHTLNYRESFTFNRDENRENNTYIGGSNNGVNTQWQKKWGRRFSSHLSVTYSEFENSTDRISKNLTNGDTPLKSRIATTLRDFSVRAEGKVMGKNQLNHIDMGFQSNFNTSYIIIDEKDPMRSVKNEEYQEGSIQSLFGSYRLGSIKNLSLNIGGRGSYYDLSDKIYLEPRLFANYQLFPALGVKGSYTWSHQYLQQLIFFDFNDVKPENFNWGLSNAERLPVRSIQSMLGFTINRSGWTFDVEAYTKEIGPIHASGGFVREGILLLEGNAEMVGIDFLIRKKLGKVSTWITYSIGKVTWDFPDLNDDPFPSYYDQTHKISVGSVAKFGNFSLSGVVRIASGVPIQDELVFIGAGPRGPQPTERYVRYEGRYPWHHQLDISGAYTYRPKTSSWNMVLSASIFNLYDNRTLLEEYSERGQDFTVYTMGFSPNVQLVVNF